MTTSTITVEELKEKILNCVFTQFLNFDYSEHSKEIIRERFEDFSMSCTYEVDYKFKPATNDFPAEATIIDSQISNLKIDFDEEVEIDTDEIEEYVNIQLAELW